MMKDRMRKQIGFTLVESLIIVAVLGILSAVAIPPIIKFVNKDNQTSSDIETQKVIGLIHEEDYTIVLTNDGSMYLDGDVDLLVGGTYKFQKLPLLDNYWHVIKLISDR